MAAKYLDWLSYERKIKDGDEYKSHGMKLKKKICYNHIFNLKMTCKRGELKGE